VRALLKRYPMPVVGTFQGAGAVSRDLVSLFYGRIGLFRNQPGDRILAKADVVLTVGYDPVEYGPEAWNAGKRASIIHIDDYPSDIDNHYEPEIELVGSVEETIGVLSAALKERTYIPSAEFGSIHAEWQALQNPPTPNSNSSVHPLSVVLTLRSLIDDETIIASDMGSHHIWMARALLRVRTAQTVIQQWSTDPRSGYTVGHGREPDLSGEEGCGDRGRRRISLFVYGA